MYEIPWIGIIGVLVGFISASALYIWSYERRYKKNQRGSIDLTKLVVTPKKHNKDIKLM